MKFSSSMMENLSCCEVFPSATMPSPTNAVPVGLHSVGLALYPLGPIHAFGQSIGFR